MLGLLASWRSLVEEYLKKMLMFQASCLSEVDSDFRRNMSGGRHQAISQWMARNGLVIRAGMHQAREAPKVIMSSAVDYIHNIARPAVST
jgi:hypothetical protein